MNSEHWTNSISIHIHSADELNADADIRQLQNDILYTVRLAACEANKYLEQFMCHDYIWLDDKHLRLKTFLQECERKWHEDDDDDDDDDKVNEYDGDDVNVDNTGAAAAANDVTGHGNTMPISDPMMCDPNLQTEMFQNQVKRWWICFSLSLLLPPCQKVTSDIRSLCFRRVLVDESEIHENLK